MKRKCDTNYYCQLLFSITQRYSFIHSFIIVDLSLIGMFYETHASRALQSHDLSGEGINFGSHTYFSDHTRTWRASPDEWSTQCRGHLRDNTNIKDYTHHSLIYSNKADMIRMIMMPKWYTGNHRGLELPDIFLTCEGKKYSRTSSRNLVQTGDRTRARCVTDAHATACSTAVDYGI